MGSSVGSPGDRGGPAPDSAGCLAVVVPVTLAAVVRVAAAVAIATRSRRGAVSGG